MVVLSVLLQYGILTGESVSAMRAVGMFLLAVGARIAGRTYDLLTALAVSAILLLLDAPANLYNSGFWLSFGAVAGLGVVAPVLAGCIRVENRLEASVMKTLVSSIAVQMTTFPIMLRIYGEISLAGFFFEPAGAADSQCSTGQWNCSNCGWNGIGRCSSLCSAAWKSAAFSV